MPDMFFWLLIKTGEINLELSNNVKRGNFQSMQVALYLILNLMV